MQVLRLGYERRREAYWAVGGDREKAAEHKNPWMEVSDSENSKGGKEPHFY